ncbi:MAG: hypothetical protein K2Q34_04295 [Alphaproteobacteria bacterium]|nr:hypothetical protein [Alphaproteobacteria bacterium]
MWKKFFLILYILIAVLWTRVNAADVNQFYLEADWINGFNGLRATPTTDPKIEISDAEWNGIKIPPEQHPNKSNRIVWHIRNDIKPAVGDAVIIHVFGSNVFRGYSHVDGAFAPMWGKIEGILQIDEETEGLRIISSNSRSPYGFDVKWSWVVAK